MAISSIATTTTAQGFELPAQPAFAATSPEKVLSEHSSRKDAHIRDRAKMQRMVEDMQLNLSHLDVSLTFSTYGKDNDDVSIVVSEKATGKVIREIPSKELQALYTKMQELVGMIFDKRA